MTKMTNNKALIAAAVAAAIALPTLAQAETATPTPAPTTAATATAKASNNCCHSAASQKNMASATKHTTKAKAKVQASE